MMIKFLSHGTGSGMRAVNYLLQERDHSGEIRAGIKVLRGNPDMVAEQIDALSFVHRYTSSVIAWALEDEPTDQDVSDVLDSFEKTAFAGLEPNQYSFLAVEHTESNGSRHVHIINPRVELRSGRSMNIAPPGWKSLFGPWRNYHNHLHGWARPDDTARFRVLQPDHQVYIDAAKIRQALEVEPDSRAVLTEMLVNKIVEGTVNNRDDIRRELADIGEITREGKDYISVKPFGFTKAIRLKGSIYGSEFDTSTLRNDQNQSNTRPETACRPNFGAAATARRKLDRKIEERIEFVRKKYSEKTSVNNEKNGAAANPDFETTGASANIAEQCGEKRQEVTTVDIEQVAQCFVDHCSELARVDSSNNGSRNDDQYSASDVYSAIGATSNTDRLEDSDSYGASIKKTVDRGVGQWRSSTHTTNKNKGMKNEWRNAEEITGQRARDDIGREIERSRNQGAEANRAVERFIRSSNAVIEACSAARKAAYRTIPAIEKVIRKIRQQSITKLKEAYQKYGQIWQRGFVAKRLKKQYYLRKQQEQKQVRDLPEVRALSDQGLQHDDQSQVFDRS